MRCLRVMKKRLKVLIEAYTCAPCHGSEPGLGWNVVSRLAEKNEVYAIVEEGKWKQEIEAYLAEHPQEHQHLHFRYIMRERYPLLRKIWPPSYYWTYRRWLRRAYEEACRWDAEEHFDLVHHVTMAGYRAPGYLWKMKKTFIWGPIGGLNNTACSLLLCLGIKGALFFLGRNLFNLRDKYFNLDVRRAAKAASAILCSTEQGVHDVQRIWGKEAEYFCELGIDSHITAPAPCSHSTGTPLRMAWVGLLTARKALPFLLRALKQCTTPVELHVVGDGEMRKQWQKQAESCAPLHRIVFHGWVSHAEVHDIINNCHAACITSVRDDTSSVTFEYLQNGIPVIALQHCGFGSVVDESCGIRIPISTPAKIVTQIAQAIQQLAENEDLRIKLSRGAIERVQRYSWDAKIDYLNTLYRRVQKSDIHPS